MIMAYVPTAPFPNSGFVIFLPAESVLDTNLSVPEAMQVIFSGGEVGPYGFDVIGSDDPNALINWLREHNYQVTSDMEPLINVYVDEGFVFLAMQLLPDESAQAVQPVKLTYPSILLQSGQ